jgi:hypothetical protein
MAVKQTRSVTIEVASTRQPEVRGKHPGIEFKPLSLRLVKYTVDETTYTLGTTLLERKAYPKAAFPDLYHARWGVEVFQPYCLRKSQVILNFNQNVKIHVLCTWSEFNGFAN